MRNKAVIALMVLAAAVLVCAHLRLPHSTQTWRMDKPSASARSGERMAVSMPDGGVDVNHAAAEELDRLNGVGPALAQAIIAERETNGNFHYPEDMINVKGIGEKTLMKMREQLKLP